MRFKWVAIKASSHRYTQMLINRHPGRDCRDPVAMDGNRSDHYKFHDKHSTIL
jgi:hypothetical protein